MTGIDDWSGKTVLIVGGAGGMGRATATEFESAGANIAIADINTGNLPPQYLAIKSDITKVSDCAGMISKTMGVLAGSISSSMLRAFGLKAKALKCRKPSGTAPSTSI